ncbi:hypothetical protein BIY29_05340 [Brenneria alni]|uniref:Phage MuF C-terminal domain-containing protein n=1 Tax=Brenneria alni TaxID=71656 RepID=A0A421DR57_9GAMM|nr:LPD38 domain-containing protein [Brenneria alni]RLM26485.1 hypothetical protein BIY29_05340 [Brenneria alni]
MANDPQQLRPEAQRANDNRQGLNIQQPGEVPAYDPQDFTLENWNKAPHERPKSTWGDDFKALAAAPLNMVAGVGQIFKAGDQILDAATTEGAEENPNPWGIDDQMMSVMRQNNGNPLSRAGTAAIQGAGELAGSAAQSILDSRTEGAKQAAAQDFATIDRDKDGNITGISAGEGLFNPSAWMQNAIPSMATMFTSAGAARLGSAAVREMVEKAAFNKLRQKLPEESARQVAKATADRAAAAAGKGTFVGSQAATEQGQGGIDMRNEINALSFDELMSSTTFQQAFSDIDTDPNYSNMDDTQKLTMARSMVAEKAANAATFDPKALAVNIGAAMLGDHTLISLVTKRAAARGILSGMAKGATAEGSTEFAQGATQRYVQNEQLIDTAGQNIDPMTDVLKTGLNNAVVGAGMGGGFGAVGGMRGRKGATEQQSTDPVAEQQRQDKQKQLEKQYGQMLDGDLLTAFQNLNQKEELTSDEQEQLQAAQSALARRMDVGGLKVDVPEWQNSGNETGSGSGIPVAKLGEDGPPPGYQGEWRDGEPVISVTSGADAPQFNPENVTGTPQSRIDEFRDTPAYLRQDPRVQGFAEDSEVQRTLSEHQPAPTADELIRQQIEQGDQGYTQEEQAILDQAEKIRASRQPRLPAPGQTSVIAMPGEVRLPVGDETQVGPGPQFDAGRQVRGEEYIPAERSQTGGKEVGRASRTFEGETVPSNAIEDKNIIFAGAPTIDEGQASQPPQFSQGETRAQRQTREFTEAMGANSDKPDGLPDQRHRVAGVPVDAQTEAYARGELVGQLKLFAGNKPYSSERVALASRWAKMPGATVEPVGDGYGVRLPPKAPNPTEADSTAQSEITDSSEINHRGYPLFPVDATRRDTGEPVKAWAVQAEPNSPIKMAPRLFETREEAVSYADRLADRDERNAVSRGKRVADHKEREAVEAEKRAPINEFLGAQNFTPMQRGKADKALLEIVNYPEFDRPLTRAEVVQRLIGRGWRPETKQRTSGDGKSKTLYRIVSDDGDLYNVTKTEHDFAAHLVAKRSSKKNSGTLYSRQNDRKDGLTVEEARRIADDFQSEYNGNIPLDIRVYARQEDAYGPQATRENIGRIPGAYHAAGKGRIVLNAASIRDTADGRATLRHEVLGHFGINTFKPADKRLVLDSLLKTREDPKFRSLWEQVRQNYGDRQESIQAEEVFAHAAELERAERNARTRRRIIPSEVLHAFQMALRRSGLVKGPMKISELYDAVDAVAAGIRSGRRQQQTFPKTDQDQFRRDSDQQQNASKPGGVVVSATDIGGGNIIHDGSFSKDGGKPAQGMTRNRVQLASDLFVSNLNGAAKIKVKAVQTQAEAAAMMPNGIPEEFGTVHAIYQPELSRVIVIADNIANPRELRAKLRHEIIAHHGLASVIGDVEYDRIMRVLHQTRDSKNNTIQGVWRQVEQSYGQESLETQANEFLAHMAERAELTKLGGVWDRFVTLLTNALRKAGILNPMDITPAEIRNILRTITGRFQKTAMYANEQPGTREFDNTFSRTDALYSQSNDNVDPLKPLPAEAEQFRENLGKAMRSLRSADTPVTIGRTPPVLRALGAPNLDMVITRDTVRKATNGVKHDVPMGVIERLPELMHDPVAVYRSRTEDNAVVVLLEANDANGDPVLSAVHMNAVRQHMEINRIASVYGTEEGKKINTMEREGLALYRREKENPGNPLSIGLQLPKEERSYQGSDSASRRYSQGLQLPKEGDPAESGQNILSSDDIRKNKTLYSRSGNPAMDAETSRKMGFNVEKGWFDKAKDFYQIATDKDKTELKQWWQETFRKLNTKTFDGLAPLKYAEDAVGKSDATVSGYTAARMSAGSRSVTAAVLEHGLVRYNKTEGITERIPGTGKADSLIGILDGLGNHRENFLKWIAGHRSERLMAEGRENNFTADEITYMKSLNRGNEKLFAEQKKKYDAFIKSIIDLQQDMGLIDPESRAMWEDAWYLPYYREAENGETHGPWTTRGIANQSSTIRKLKGSDLTIKDPIENLFNYVAKSVDASMKNEAMRRSVVNLGDTGVIDIIENPNQIDYQRLKKDTVKVFVDGKEQLARINDPDLYRAFTMIDLERSNSLFMRAARQAKRVLTIGTTAMPDFIIRNFVRDAIHSWAINKDGFRLGLDSLKGLKKAMSTDDTLVDMMFAGATFGGGYSNVYDPAGTASSIRKVLRRKGYNDSQIREFESSIVRSSKEAMDKVGWAMEKYKKVSEGAENANRIATYDAAIKAGKSRAQAAFESRDLMDFSMMGASNLMINLSDMLPFFNARMQGLSKLSRAIKDNPQEVLKRSSYIMAASLALLALNWDRKEYEELPDWDKDTYWHFWTGDQHWRVPKPFELGLLSATIPERFVRALGSKDSPAKFGKLVAHNFIETMAFNPIPQVAMPIAEAYVNYDFFKGGPIENMADSNLIAGARYNDQTSLLMREIGEATNLSPKMLDHIITGYTGTLGAYILGATNIVMRNLGDSGESPSLRLDEMPVIKAFARGSDPAKSTQFTEDFYRMMTQANQINSTINDYRKQGRQDNANELLQENKGKLSQRRALTATQKQVKQLNAQIELTRADRILTSEQKRERIDRLMAKRNKLVQLAVERVNPYFD